MLNDVRTVAVCFVWSVSTLGAVPCSLYSSISATQLPITLKDRYVILQVTGVYASAIQADITTSRGARCVDVVEPCGRRIEIEVYKGGRAPWFPGCWCRDPLWDTPEEIR